MDDDGESEAEKERRREDDQRRQKQRHEEQREKNRNDQWRRQYRNLAAQADDQNWYTRREFERYYGRDDGQRRFRNGRQLGPRLASDLGKIVWAWQTSSVKRHRRDDKEDKEWPYFEDCYPVGHESEYQFYKLDQWFPP